MRLAVLALASLLLAPVVAAELPDPVPGAPVSVEDGLAQVVDDALAANLELSAGAASVRQRIAALDQARARYLPVLDVPRRGRRACRRDPHPADPAHVRDGRRRPDAARGARLGPLLAARDRDHRGARHLDAAGGGS